MKKTIILAQSILVLALFSCQAPGTPTPETSPSPEASAATSSGVSLDANVDINTGISTGTDTEVSGDANSALTVEVEGQTYTRGQLKTYYVCAANGNSALKSAAALMVTDIEAADSGNPAAASIYVRAATNVPNYKLTGCSL